MSFVLWDERFFYFLKDAAGRRCDFNKGVEE